MTGRDYIDSVLVKINDKHGDKPEYVQAIEEVYSTLEPYLDQHPEIEEHNILELLSEPERVIQFRVPWEDDEGNWRVNLGWRVQFNSTLGPYKGGIRFVPTVNESIMRFLAFEQTFKNALTNLPMGGGKGGSDFTIKGKSENEVMRFVQSFMTELHKYIGAHLDVPAGDIGVHHREIGYMYGQYKRLNEANPGVITGKPTSLWGSFGRTEATGYGLMYFADKALRDRDLTWEGKKIVVSGVGNVGMHTIEKANQLGATVVAASDSQGYIYDENGIDAEIIRNLPSSLNTERTAIKEYVDASDTATYYEGESVWNGDFDYEIAFPCATQNEIDVEFAQNMIDSGVKAVFEGANMPNSDDAVKLLKENGVVFAPGKAANAGGVAISGLEMTQNTQFEQWTFEEVDKRLKDIMEDIYKLCSSTAEKYVGNKDDLQAGANIAGFARVANAMIQQGLV